jgi:hypothetical protein
MDVTLTFNKLCGDNGALMDAINVAEFEPIKAGGVYVALDVSRGNMRVSSYGGGMNAFAKAVPVLEGSETAQTIYLDLDNARKIKGLKKPSNNKIRIWLIDANTLGYETSMVSGSVYLHPPNGLGEIDISRNGYKKTWVINNIRHLKAAFKHALHVSSGWYEDEIPAETNYVWFGMQSVNNLSRQIVSGDHSYAFTVFASDEQRCFQTFIDGENPIDMKQISQDGPATAYIYDHGVNDEIFGIRRKLLDVMVKVLPNKGKVVIRARRMEDGRVIEWMIVGEGFLVKFQNGLRQPQADYSRFIHALDYQTTIRLNVDRDFKTALGDIATLRNSDKEYFVRLTGLTIDVINDTITFSSPRQLQPMMTVSRPILDSTLCDPELDAVVDAEGVATTFKHVHTLLRKNASVDISFAKEATVIFNPVLKVRTVLVNYVRE